MEIFDFDSISLRNADFRDTETTKLIGKPIAISVSISSNLIQEPIFLCDPNPSDLVSFFIDVLENLTTQSKPQVKINFVQFETAIKNRLARILEVLKQRRCHCVGIEEEDENSGNSSSHFLQMQKYQLIHLQDQFERQCFSIPVFDFNNTSFDINLIKCYLLPMLVSERGF